MVDTEEIRRRLDASSWLGVGVIGLAVFALGVYQPALGRFPHADALRLVVAIAGGVISVAGLTFWWDSRAEEREHPRRRPLKGRARELSIAPSLEVYHPDTVGSVRALPPPPDDDDDS